MRMKEEKKMELKLVNIAKIEYAELKLNGITVIAGENNTGKSTVGKVVFSLYNSLVNIEDKIAKQKEQQFYQLFKRKTEHVLYPGSDKDRLDRIYAYYVRWLSKRLNTGATEEELSKIVNEKLDFGDNNRVEITLDKEFFEEVNKINSLSIERLAKSAVSAYFKRVFYSEINNIYKKNDDAIIDATIKGKSIRIKFRNDNCIDIQQQINIVNEAVYLDNPFVLNCLNNGNYSRDEIELVTLNKLRKNVDAVEDVVQYSLITDKIGEVIKKIGEVTSGSLLRDEAHSYFYKENGDEKLNINNLSAGFKSFVIIKTLLEKGSLMERDVLILDEPEIHLHPAWQLIYAEVIVLLQKTFDLTIVLTTHSAHFLDALNYFAKLHKVADKCNYYLARTGDCGSVMEDVTDDISRIYSELVDPSILLDKLKYKMEEAQDE